MRITRCDVCKKDIGVDTVEVVYTLVVEGARGYKMSEHNFHWDCLPIWVSRARGDASETTATGEVPGQTGLQEGAGSAGN